MAMIVRFAENKDLDGLYELAQKAGTGMTTVPNSRDALAERIAQCAAARNGKGKAGPKDIFFFVLEFDGRIEGMSSIFPSLGDDRPFYSYRISKVAAAAPELGIQASSELLYLCNDFHGYDEIGTLLVSEKVRGTGAGRLLSLSRFMFMKAIEDRLSGNVMAEIRGRFDDRGESPFWNAVASKFFHMSFLEADVRSAHDFRFIADLMPKFPIYTELLPEEARAVIGKPHVQSAPAMNMLIAEGFRFTRCVDIFDAGPSLEAQLKNIRTVRDMKRPVIRVQPSIPAEGSSPWMVASPNAENFRCSLIRRGPQDGSLFVTPEEGDCLGVKSGDRVMATPVRSKKG